MARKKNKNIGSELDVEKLAETGEVETKQEEAPEAEAIVEPAPEEDTEEQKQDLADAVIKEANAEVASEEGYVTVSRFHRSAYAGMKGKIIQDLVSAYKLETELGIVIMPKDQVK